MTRAIWSELSSLTERIERLERERHQFGPLSAYRDHLERQLQGARKRKARLIAVLCDGARSTIGIDRVAGRSRR
jgi:hypothetical protein